MSAAEGTEEEEWLYGESATVISVTPAEVKPEPGGPVVAGEGEEGEPWEGGVVDPSALQDPQSQDGLVGEGLQGEEPQAPSRKRGLEDGDDPEADREGSEEEAPDSKGESGEEGEESDSDDSVHVVIGPQPAKGGSGPVVGAPITARSGGGGPPPDKKGKFSTEDFDTAGQINGVPAHEFSLDAIDEKPWRKPGADITDYFNYGFTEDTWRAYCDRQRRLRYESGTPVAVNSSKNQPQGQPLAVIGDGSKYGGDRGSGPQNIQFSKRLGQGPGGMGPGMRKDGMMGMGPPPGMGMGMGMGLMPPMPMGMGREDFIRENSIQVMTADRREYSRKPYEMGPMGPGGPGFDMSIPPPSFQNRDFMGGPPPDFYNHPPPQEYYMEEEPDYEEQQWMDSQWEMEDQSLGRVGPSSALVVPLTKVAVVPPPPGEGPDDLPPGSPEDKKPDTTK